MAFAEDLVFGDQKPVPLRCRAGQPRNPLPSQNFALREVSCGSSLENHTIPAQEFLQVSLIKDSALEVCYEHEPQVPAKRPLKHQVQEGHAAR